MRSGLSASFRLAVGDNAALFEDQHPVGIARGKRKIVHDGEHRTSAARRPSQQFHDHELMTRIERHGRLVRQHDLRLRRQHARKRDAGALAAGQRRHDPAAEVLECR